MAKTDARRGPDPLTIRAAMRQRVAHFGYPRRINRLGRAQMKNTRDSAHMGRLAETGHAVHPLRERSGGGAKIGQGLLGSAIPLPFDGKDQQRGWPGSQQ